LTIVKEQLVFTWIIAGSLVVAAPALKEQPKPKAPVGRFMIVRWEVDGVVVNRPDLANYVMRHETSSVTLELNGRDVKSEMVTFSHAGGVGHADFRTDESSPVKKAIWKLEGDILTACESEPGGERPMDFTAPKGSKRTLWVLKRIKD
jgi:uncharacterized protein (TIGR03067 family)